MSASIDTEKFSAQLRAKAIRRERREILITNFRGTAQEGDLTEPCNCEGYGRIRHFKRDAQNWTINPLPIEPAARRLGLAVHDTINAQVFQNGACNWRCWYCFVPFDLLKADEKHASWLTAEKLVDMFEAAGKPARMIDLSGGQPELTPEWVPWMMEALTERGLASEIFLWSDDNLSNDYFWRYLSAAEIERVRRYPMYAKVCCFKGFDAESFSFNTKAAPELFAQQFNLFGRYLDIGLDLYAYATFTAPDAKNINSRVAEFVDRLQAVHPNLPLRTVPLKIISFSVVEARHFPQQPAALAAQQVAIEAWQAELARRFSSAERSLSIVDVALRWN